MEYLPRGEQQPYTTVLGLLQAMEKAGLVDHEKKGLTHLYQPTVSRQEATGSLLADFLARFFHGSAVQLVQGLVDSEKLAPAELRAIEARLATAGMKPPLDDATADSRAKSQKRRKAP